MADKNQAIVTFLLECQQIKDSPLYFNFINAKNDAKQIMTVSNDTLLNRPYIDGSVLKRYSFTIIDFKSISDSALVNLVGYSNENIEELADVQSLMDWIKEQNDVQNYPDFGKDCEIQEMKTTAENPTLDGINEDEQLAMYSFTIQIDYIDYSKKIWR